MPLSHTGSPQDNQTLSYVNTHFETPLTGKTIIQSNLHNQSKHKCKTYLHKHQRQIWEELVPSDIALVKKHIINIYKARTCWCHWPFHRIYQYHIKKKKHISKEWTEIITSFFYMNVLQYIYQCHIAAYCTYHHPQSAQQEPYKKASLLTKQQKWEKKNWG